MNTEKINDKRIGISSSGNRLYHAINYKWSEEDKCMIPYYEKPVDRFQMIQASKNSTDISAIVKRAAAGDISVLNVKTGSYSDVSDLPDNLNDMHALNVEAVNSFAKLDPKIQGLFDNDYEVFAEAVQNGSYTKIINDYIISANKQSVEKKEGAE